MKLLLGLGNIGKQYENTRHNAGFWFVDFVAQKVHASPWNEEKKFFAFTARGELSGEKCLLVKPTTLMNLSGKSLQAILHFYRIDVHDVMVVFDDVDLPLGMYRFRQKGGSGGHNGIKSLQQALGTSDFSRLKFGIRTDMCDRIDTSDFVLGKFSPSESDTLRSLFPDAYDDLLRGSFFS